MSGVELLTGAQVERRIAKMRAELGICEDKEWDRLSLRLNKAAAKAAAKLPLSSSAVAKTKKTAKAAAKRIAREEKIERKFTKGQKELERLVAKAERLNKKLKRYGFSLTVHDNSDFEG